MVRVGVGGAGAVVARAVVVALQRSVSTSWDNKRCGSNLAVVAGAGGRVASAAGVARRAG